MAQVCIKYNPYRLETTLTVNGQDLTEDSSFYKVTKGKRLQEWIGEFPQKLRDELNTIDFSLKFIGMELDWDDFKDAFEQAERNGIVRISDLRFVAGKSDDDITEKVIQIFNDLQEGPIDDFRDPELTKAFERVQGSVFPINVIATMSSGKSTLINALLRGKLMPSKNEACTATITEILDNDEPVYTAVVYDENDEVIQEIPDLSYEIMDQLNSNEKVHKICIEGNIPFLDSRSTALMLVDTPGPNNSQNQAHKNTTYRAINNDSQSLVLYVLNGTQLATNDDSALLHYVSDQIKKGGKQVRDRFLFVINKMDAFTPETENIGRAIDAAKRYLARYDIEDPQIFPCSAYTALNIRTCLADVDIDNLTRAQERALSSPARDTIAAIDKLLYSYTDPDSGKEVTPMYLEQYSTLSPSAQSKLSYQLKKAEDSDDTKTQALIHSGICSIEAAITAYVKKYAKTKKIKDLVETFQAVLESREVLAKAKENVATNEEAARACISRADAMQKQIQEGKAAKQFKQKIQSLDPMPQIRQRAEKLKTQVNAQAGKVFKYYGATITSRDEARRLVMQFSSDSSDALGRFTSELESVINNEIVDTGRRLLTEYQEKLSKFDDSASGAQLDFKTADLVKDVLNRMREQAEGWTTDEFATETIEDVGEITYETQTYYEKVGQEEEEIVVGSHEEKVGTRKVRVGSHREKVGTYQVKNPAKRWWKIFTPKYVDEDVYRTVDDYKDEDVYKTVLDYKTIMRDVFETRTKQIEKFSVPTGKLQAGLFARLRQNLDEGTEITFEHAADQVKALKAQFSKSFDELDKLINDKYEEMKRFASDQKANEKLLEENKAHLQWIEDNLREINSILEMGMEGEA